MKFDFIIGNPPYQDETLGDNQGFAPPIYHLFLDGAYSIADAVEMIHPARFLFNAGSTPKAWNQKMLSDPHLKVVHYESDASKIFSNTEIKGGIAITYRDFNKDFGAIGTFTADPTLNGIINRVHHSSDFDSISTIAISSYAYHFTETLHVDHPEIIRLLSKGHANDLKSNVIEKLPMVFLDEKPNDGEEYVKVLGRVGSGRTYKFIKAKYINEVKNLPKWKVFMSKANSSGVFGEALSPSIIGAPYIGSTETFMSVGAFDTKHEADNLLKYILTKFFRALLGVLKTTQDLTPQKFKYVPLQDFTPSSDIDWSQSIPDIDKQLYAKYGLDEDEINFIETHVKEMA